MAAIARGLAAADLPLVVDLDGTLIKTDMLVEGALRSLLTRPATLLSLPRWLAAGKAMLKLRLAEHVNIDVDSLPYNEDLLQYCKEERARGRRIYLASAASRALAEAVAHKVGVFDAVFASDEQINLAGPNKAARLCEEFGERGFDYAGDAPADLHVWKRANRIIGVSCQQRFMRQLQASYPDAQFIGKRAGGPGVLARALRVHQWAKNALLFVPAVAAHAVGLDALAVSLVSFFAFSLVASSVYLINDLIDLSSDRAHPSKRHRPFASGDLPLMNAAWLIPSLLAGGFGLAALISWPFAGVLVGYFCLTLAYSLWLKRMLLVDVLVLAGLYTLRIVAGAVALAIAVSPWLLGFSLFLFLALAIVKRYTELQRLIGLNKMAPAGRSYRLDDLPVLGALGAASSFSAVLVFTLYINSPAVMPLYSSPVLLWLVCPLLVYWLTRLLMLAHRGQMHDDPVVFAMQDRTSLLTIGLSLVVVAAAATL
jgi:4-hydroxybenzoate polyprenyltransferase/phosphoserine phosphatase